ncbi:MAG: hypothetical protein J7485_12045 [Sphingobium sp.]|nr:hypothetical protein [Sphingobium sp.]
MFADTPGDSRPKTGIETGPQAQDAPNALVQALSGTGGGVTSAAAAVRMNDGEIALAQAHRTLQFIRCSKDFFPAMRDLADHPGWEIVLHVFIAGREGRAITTAELCDRTGTWRPLAVRYVEMLFERGLIDRDISAGKPDAWALALTPSTEARLQELLCSFWSGFRGQYEADAAN